MGGFAATMGGLIKMRNRLSTPRGANQNSFVVGINPPGAYSNGGLFKTLHRRPRLKAYSLRAKVEAKAKKFKEKRQTSKEIFAFTSFTQSEGALTETNRLKGMVHTLCFISNYAVLEFAFTLKLPIQTLVSVALTRSVFWCAT